VAWSSAVCRHRRMHLNQRTSPPQPRRRRKGPGERMTEQPDPDDPVETAPTDGAVVDTRHRDHREVISAVETTGQVGLVALAGAVQPGPVADQPAAAPGPPARRTTGGRRRGTPVSPTAGPRAAGRHHRSLVVRGALVWSAPGPRRAGQHAPGSPRSPRPDGAGRSRRHDGRPPSTGRSGGGPGADGGGATPSR
jgi:hypothetical protein